MDSLSNLESKLESGVISFTETESLALKGNLDAKYLTAMCYYDGDYVERDTFRACELLSEASDSGHIKSIHELGCFKYYGYGFSEDFKNTDEAITLLTNSANQGYKPSIDMLDFIHKTTNKISPSF